MEVIIREEEEKESLEPKLGGTITEEHVSQQNTVILNISVILLFGLFSYFVTIMIQSLQVEGT